MVNIDQYLVDGADWTAQAVLAHLKGKVWRLMSDKYYDKGVSIKVGRYENFREDGYVFVLRLDDNKEDLHVQRNYAVYPHRITDRLCVLKANLNTLNTPTVDEILKNRIGEEKMFEWDDTKECAEYILDDMEHFLENYIK